ALQRRALVRRARAAELLFPAADQPELLMDYTSVVISTDGSMKLTTLDHEPTLEDLQHAVAGYNEIVPHFTTLTMGKRRLTDGIAFCNEDGRQPRLPINHAATLAWRAARPTGDPARMLLVGDVIFVTPPPD